MVGKIIGAFDKFMILVTHTCTHTCINTDITHIHISINILFIYIICLLHTMHLAAKKDGFAVFKPCSILKL